MRDQLLLPAEEVRPRGRGDGLARPGDRGAVGGGGDGGAEDEPVVVAEAGKPREADTGGAERRHRLLQQPGALREPPVEFEPVRSRAGVPEQGVRPGGRLHPLVVGPARARHDDSPAEKRREVHELVRLGVVDAVARADDEAEGGAGLPARTEATQRAGHHLPGVEGERLLGPLGGHEGFGPRPPGELLEELEASGRRDVRKLEVREVDEAEETRGARAEGTRLPVDVAHQAGLAGAVGETPVGAAPPAPEHGPCGHRAVDGGRRVLPRRYRRHCCRRLVVVSVGNGLPPQRQRPSSHRRGAPGRRRPPPRARRASSRGAGR